MAIIQARVGSTRLPGKVLSDICGKTMLERVILRTSAAKCLDEIVVATTLDRGDDLIEAYLSETKLCKIFRGSKDDVLKRYFDCATINQADLIVRITADDPLKDPEIIEKAVEIMIENKELDYCSNTIFPSYPEGLDVEVFKYSALERAFYGSSLNSEREHVTPFIWKNKFIFCLKNFHSDLPSFTSKWRWTVDTADDLKFMRAVYANFANSPLVSYRKVYQWIKKSPNIISINGNQERNSGYIKSLAEEE